MSPSSESISLRSVSGASRRRTQGVGGGCCYAESLSILGLKEAVSKLDVMGSQSAEGPGEVERKGEVGGPG
jgi:hypothetical protein